MESNGLYLGAIRPVFDYDTVQQQVNIRFVIDSGRRASFGPPVLVGNFNLDPKRVLRATAFRRWIIHTWKPVTQVRVRQGVDGVRKLLQKDNRLQGTVALESMKYDCDTNRATPTLRIEAGAHSPGEHTGAPGAEGPALRPH